VSCKRFDKNKKVRCERETALRTEGLLKQEKVYKIGDGEVLIYRQQGKAVNHRSHKRERTNVRA